MDSNDHDILTDLAKDVCWIKKILENHLKHHWCVTLSALTAAVGAMITVAILLLKGVWK